jgi:hypothetical protein
MRRSVIGAPIRASTAVLECAVIGTPATMCPYCSLRPFWFSSAERVSRKRGNWQQEGRDKAVTADKAYDSEKVRQQIKDEGALPIIPSRCKPNLVALADNPMTVFSRPGCDLSLRSSWCRRLGHLPRSWRKTV